MVQYWQAFDAVEPINGEDERHAYLCHMLDHLLAALVNQNLTKQDWSKRYKPRPPEQFMPRASQFKKPSKKTNLLSQLKDYGNHYQSIQRRANT